ncbi:unnamed protein product [Prunus armeniaca]|uniref:DUF1421 domain-containing protein n=1 Tax=Prunus armeniaca TaxID=36596 RepID=A0A6J5XB15_PRUAR|nr:unnamed protein product [Prunus armeniaca]CAB4311136.1 unnamed protein product [Prunus armeniaca]
MIKQPLGSSLTASQFSVDSSAGPNTAQSSVWNLRKYERKCRKGAKETPSAMTSSEFMDKQIMELSRSHSDDLSQLSYPRDLRDDEDKDDDSVSSFHFRPTRHVVSQQSRVSTFENCSSMNHIDLAKSGCKYAGAFDDSALISVIGQKMSHHFDNMLHAVEGLSARLSQLETRLRRLENSVDDLKDSTEINHGRNDGKLRQLENILREVEGGMQDLKDKQEISEAKLQLATLQMLKGHQQLENQRSNVQTISTQGGLSSAPQQSHQPHSTPVAGLQLSSFPPNVPPTQPHQNLPPAPAAQVHTHSLQNQIPSVQQTDSNYSPPVLNPQPAPQIYYMPQVQQSLPPPTAPYQYYPPAPHLSPTSQLQRLPQLHPPLNTVDPRAQSSLVHNPGETPYMLSQRYPPSMHKSPNATGMTLPTQQQYMGSFQYTHDQSTRNHCSDLSSGHMQPVQHSTLDDFYSHEGSPSHNSGSKTKHSQILPASLDRSGGSSISRLPTAQVLPYAIPMASSMDKESSSGATGNRIPIDNVVDEVVTMGFRRDIVRATVKKMTENGQSVDINVVLDKLMNNGEVEPQSGGFGR